MSSKSLGIDIGALTVKWVLLDAMGQIEAADYGFHRGRPLVALRAMLESARLDAPAHVAVTGSGASLVPADRPLLLVDAVQATIAATQRMLPQAQNVIDIGGASVKLIRLDAQGRFHNFASNTQCAAGTGSFLDEQAQRLGLSHERMAELRSVVDPPPVATRCAVFAKSDLIHLQQSGASVEQMWSGLCRGMAQTALQTLLKGKPLGAPTALVGGVARNQEVLRWLGELADAPVTTCDQAHVAGALGAALLARQVGNGHRPGDLRLWLAEPRAAAARLEPAPVCSDPQGPCVGGQPGDGRKAQALSIRLAKQPLILRRTRYPSFDVQESFTDGEGNEVRVSRWPHEGPLSGFLGIDIGSTSTKLCFIDMQGEVLVDIYRKTAGDPVNATKKLFEALRALSRHKGTELVIEGCGTTGSGRKLVGALVGADAVINEISAHVAGAMYVDPELETIFEIGGQDSKYMRTQNGRIADANMNYVCAAGTGSFVEEQARKLNVPLQEVGDRVLGLVPPETSDRCTVFMEQDVNDLLRAGHDVDHALAAVMRSVVQNYLNKVVGNRHYSQKRIGFQGATARNKGLVAAFETLLGVEMVVSPYCHVMGAWGVALRAREQILASRQATGFRGLNLAERKIELRKERCDLCHNECDITFAHIEGCQDEPSWGYVCGRDPEENKVRVYREYDLFRSRRRWLLRDGTVKDPGRNGTRPVRVAVPRALSFFSHLPLWRALLEQLGATVVLTHETTRQTRERGASLVGAEFCFPVKLAHGQVGEAFDAAADYVLVPRMVAQPPAGRQSDTYFCPYVQSLASIVQSAMMHAGQDTTRLLDPVLDRRRPEPQQVKDLHRVLGPALGVNERQVRQAYRRALEVQAGFEARCAEAGRKTMDELARQARKGIVLIGRPYNVTDPTANLDLPSKIAEMGFPVIPIDFLPYDPATIAPRYRNMYWAYGQRILAALQTVSHHEHLFPIYFTNFNCGPDSFLLSYAEEIMGNKPMLSLELDEHGADAGYITRIEAFLDVVRDWRPTTTVLKRAPHPAPAAAVIEPGTRPATERPAARLLPMVSSHGNGRRCSLEPVAPGECTASRRTPAAARLEALEALEAPASAAVPQDGEILRGRKLWIPPMHPVSSELFAATFRGAGYDAAALPTEERQDLDRGQRLTRGCECLPMRTTVGCFLNAIEAEEERGKPHALFMPTAQGPCRFGQYATLDQLIFERTGLAGTPILSPSGDNAYCGLTPEIRRSLWDALLAADMLSKLTYRVRPYETTPGDTDAALARWRGEASRAMEAQEPVLDVIARAGQDFGRIPRRDERRPLVGIVGEIYVRNNPFSNEDLVRRIERAGGEAWLAPIPEWILFTTWQDAYRQEPLLQSPRQLLERAKRRLRLHFMQKGKHDYWKAAGPLLAEREEPPIAEIVRAGQPYIPFNVGGEVLVSLGRSVHFVHQGVSFVVNASPFGCMAGTIAASLFARFEKDMGVPVLSLFYEGTGGVNQLLDVFLANLGGGSVRPAVGQPTADAATAVPV